MFKVQNIHAQIMNLNFLTLPDFVLGVLKLLRVPGFARTSAGEGRLGPGQNFMSGG